MKELKSSAISERNYERFLITAYAFEKLLIEWPQNNIWEHANLQLYYSIFIILSNRHASLTWWHSHRKVVFFLPVIIGYIDNCYWMVNFLYRNVSVNSSQPKTRISGADCCWARVRTVNRGKGRLPLADAERRMSARGGWAALVIVGKYLCGSYEVHILLKQPVSYKDAAASQKSFLGCESTLPAWIPTVHSHSLLGSL